MIKNSLREVKMPEEISTSGAGLSVLITSAYNYHFNWMSYASWYSINHYLPDAKIAITSGRPRPLTNYYYHWVYKCEDLRYYLHKNASDVSPYLNKIYGVYLALKEELVKQPLIVLDGDMMAVSDLSVDLIDKLKDVRFATSPCPYDLNFNKTPVGPLWYFNNVSLKEIENVILSSTYLMGKNHADLLSLSNILGNDTIILEDLGNEATKDLTTFAHYAGGCGNFVKKDWEKGKIVPPFHGAYALQSVDMSPNEKRILNSWTRMANLWEAVNQLKV